MLAVGFFLVQRGRMSSSLAQTDSAPMPPAAHLAAPPRQTRQPQGDDKTALLQAIADLDDAFEAGELEDDEYQQQRRELKNRLTNIWH